MFELTLRQLVPVDTVPRFEGQTAQRVAGRHESAVAVRRAVHRKQEEQTADLSVLTFLYSPLAHKSPP